MSIIPPALSRALPFFLSHPMECPYLPARLERKLFTRLTGDPAADSEINSTLTRAGFRRSHDIVYRPACGSCNACVPVRIPVFSFLPSRSLRRVQSLNNDLYFEMTPARATQEQYALFNAYEKARHGDSEMAQMSWDDYRFMVEDGTVDTVILHLRNADNKLMGCMIADRVNDGYSAVYSFFSNDEPRRSLGTQLILTLISEAERASLPYAYLGYWIAGSRKMAYKARFEPLQALGTQGWHWLERKDDTPDESDENKVPE